VELQGQIEELRAQGLGMTATSYDQPAVLRDFAQRSGITYPLLSDEDAVTITEYGILNTVAEEGIESKSDDPALQADIERYVSVFGAVPFIVGTPFPGTFIVDRDRRVTARFFEDFYRERSTVSRIMLRLEADTNPISGFEGSTAHLTVRAYQSNPEVSVGSLFVLGLDITPAPGIHVYAPGAAELGYREIRLTFAPTSQIRPGEFVYPASEIYHFAPLDERIPVYQTRFTLL
jgi:hypothetical protein